MINRSCEKLLVPSHVCNGCGERIAAMNRVISPCVIRGQSVRNVIANNAEVFDGIKERMVYDTFVERFGEEGQASLDLLRQTDEGLQPIEIKSSTTWSQSLSDGLRKYQKLFPDAVQPTVIYGGKSYPAGDTGITASNYLDFT